MRFRRVLYSLDLRPRHEVHRHGHDERRLGMDARVECRRRAPAVSYLARLRGRRLRRSDRVSALAGIKDSESGSRNVGLARGCLGVTSTRGLNATAASLTGMSRETCERRRVRIVRSVLALGAAVAFITPAALGGSPASVQNGATVACGVERWTVKTLQDRPRLIPLRDTTIAYLVSRPRPDTLGDRRLPFERHIFRVTAAVTLVRSEDDGDFHIVLSDGQRTMIAESPSTSCVRGATPTRRRQMAQARAQVRLCPRARVTGVAFFDFFHGQTGIARNAIELHPILGFRCLSG